jgi:glyoxylase-like metal-dependent hydrolase (beta-lactamase superfamily II)/rhodanese-related sulfurtransferase
VEIVSIQTPSLGDRSYLVHDGTVGLVVDPQRDIDRVEQALRAAGVRLSHVAETHVHNDYVSGGLVLAQRHRAEYLVSAAERVGFQRRPVTDGDELAVGALTMRAVAAPGHTRHHMAYVVTGGGRTAAFSGGSLLYGSVGRTDLEDPALTVELTHAQYHSARRLAELAGDPASLHPTHGFGSFCSSGPATAQDSSTIAEQRTINDALSVDDEERFVRGLIAGLNAYPSYYAHVGPINRAGPRVADLTVPAPIDAAELRERITGGEWVVDLRERTAFGKEHLAGTVNVEHGDLLATTVGWTLPWGRPLTLVGSDELVRSAIRELARIGIDGLDNAVGADVAALADGHPVASYDQAGWADVLAMTTAGGADVLLDVRRAEEFDESHLPGAVHVPLHELLERMHRIPPGRVWVHCATGFRAGVAASLLQRAGREVVHINADFEDAAAAGLAG